MYHLALSNKSGDLFEEPKLMPTGRLGRDVVPMNDDDFIPIPPGSSLSMMIDRIALGRDKKKRIVEVKKIGKESMLPVATIIPPGYTRTHLPAYKRKKKARILPFFAYTATAIKGENIYCAAIKIHDDIRWDPMQYNSLDLPGKIKRKLKNHKNNRLLKHLSNCSIEYKCFTAQNIFYERWEGGIPVSPLCNARCGGCISENRIAGVPSPQDRIKFIPTVEEIVEIAVPHLETKGGIISFGQGCEGEPLLKGKIIASAIREIRNKTDKGTININTNASLPDIMDELFDAGLDSMRVSLNSVIEERYRKYFNPKGYEFGDVIESIKRGKEKGIFISLNYLFLPGINDREEEREVFFRFLEEHKIDMIQIRNFNIDPDYYFKIMDQPGGKSIGVKKYLDEIKNQFPGIKLGNFSIPLR